MVLDNYIKYIYGSTVRDTGDSGVREQMEPHLKSLTGEENYIYPGSRNTFVNFAACRNLISELYTADYGQFCLALGTNDTAPTKGDYAFANEITALNRDSYSMDTVGKGNKTVLRITKTVSNPTTEDIIVKEIGLIVSLSNMGTETQNLALLAREVLDEPITVKANGGIQVFGIDIG
jgi:hypothetical protein